MSSYFIGLPISAELSNGTVVEGVVDRIDPSTGKLHLTQARFLRYDGSFSETKPILILEKDSVKDLMLLSTTRQTTSTTSPSSYDHSHHHHHIQNNHLHRDHKSLPNPRPSTNSSTPKSEEDLGNHLASLNLNHHKNLKITNTNKPRRKRDHPTHKKSQTNYRHHRNDLDVSHNLTNHGPDGGFSAHEDTDRIPTPQLSPPITTAQVETNPTPKVLTSDFSQDFDFQAGLMAFDKAKLWAEIASTDSSDPNDRLIAHNRKKIHDGTRSDQTKSKDDYSRSRNLGPTEMVLSAQEQVTNGSTVSNPWLQSPNTIRKTSYILSNEGYPIYPVKFDRLNHALSSASVEYGPSLVQRIENASRSMTDYIIKILRKSRSTSSPDKKNSTLSISILVGSHGPKGSCAIRTGALLANKGFKVFAALGSTLSNRKIKTKNDAFEFQLRLLSSTGAIVCSDIQDLPPSPAVIIEAMAENSITPLNDYHGKINRAWIAYTHLAPTISIDMPSYLNYDTGEPLVESAYVPAHKYLVCLGALPNGAVHCKSISSEVCLVDLTLSDACWNDPSDGNQPENERTKTAIESNRHSQSINNHSSVVPPATWGDEWYTTIKIF